MLATSNGLPFEDMSCKHVTAVLLKWLILTRALTGVKSHR